MFDNPHGSRFVRQLAKTEVFTVALLFEIREASAKTGDFSPRELSIRISTSSVVLRKPLRVTANPPDSANLTFSASRRSNTASSQVIIVGQSLMPSAVPVAREDGPEFLDDGNFSEWRRLPIVFANQIRLHGFKLAQPWT